MAGVLIHLALLFLLGFAATPARADPVSVGVIVSGLMVASVPMLLSVVVGFVIGLAILWLRGRRRQEAASPEAADRRRWQRWEDHCATHMRETAGLTAITPPGLRDE